MYKNFAFTIRITSVLLVLLLLIFVVNKLRDYRMTGQDIIKNKGQNKRSRYLLKPTTTT